MIILPSQMNYDASSSMNDVNFLKNWGIEKYKIIFSKQAWHAGLYDKTNSSEVI